MEPDYTLGKTRIQVLQGDVWTEPSDALITAINSSGAWFGGIDGAIQSVAGDAFHSQAAQHELKNLKTVVARGNGSNRGAFKNVVFVVDDLKSKLREVIVAGLRTADEAGFETVTLPGIRLGVMLGVVEKSLDEAYREMETGLRSYLGSHPQTGLRNIKFVLRD